MLGRSSLFADAGTGTEEVVELAQSREGVERQDPSRAEAREEATATRFSRGCEGSRSSRRGNPADAPDAYESGAGRSSWGTRVV
jgi:hypothetical protein